MLNQVTMSFEGSLLFIAARRDHGLPPGVEHDARARSSTTCVLAPMMLDAGVIEAAGFRRISSWSLWIGVPMMVTSGLLLFFMQWKTVVRAFSTHRRRSSRSARRGERSDGADRGARLVVHGRAAWCSAPPRSASGTVCSTSTWWMGVIAVLAHVLAGGRGRRAPTGETDITPIGPLRKITQLTFGAIAPGNITTNLMTANITAGAVSARRRPAHRPQERLPARRQPAPAVPRPVLRRARRRARGGAGVLHPDPERRRCWAPSKWPAPAAQVWRGVAELLAKGVGSLHPTARIGLLVGALVGIVLPLLEMAFPKHEEVHPVGHRASGSRSRSTASTRSRCSSARALALWLSQGASPKIARGVHGAGGLGNHRRREPDGRGDRAADRGGRVGIRSEVRSKRADPSPSPLPPR